MEPVHLVWRGAVRTLVFAIILVLWACQPPGRQLDPSEQPANDAIEAPETLLGESSGIFPPKEGRERPGMAPDDLDTLVEQARRTRPARAATAKTAPKVLPVNVRAATGAPERSKEGDYRRFKALNNVSEAETIEPGAPLVIKFDRAVSLPREQGTSPAQSDALLNIWPGVAGKLTWTGTDELTFEPAAPWEPGQAYYAKLQRNPASRLGRALIENFEWRFTVRDNRTHIGNKALGWEPELNRPRLVGWWPYNHSDLSPGQRVALIFDQPVDPTQIQPQLQYLRMRVPNASASSPEFAFDDIALHTVQKASYGGYDFPAENVVEVEPDPKLVQGQSFQIMVPGALLSPEDGRSMWWMTWSTASPLEVTESNCYVRPCDAKTSFGCTVPCKDVQNVAQRTEVSFAFNNKVSRESFAKHLSIKPAPKSQNHYYYGTRHMLHLGLEPGEVYEVSLNKGLEDAHGFELSQQHTIKLVTQDNLPTMALETRAGTLEVNGPRALPMRLSNVPSFGVRAMRLDKHTIPYWLGRATKSNESPFGLTTSAEGLKTWKVQPGIPTNRRASFDLSLQNVIPKGPGIALVEVGAEVTHGPYGSKHRFRQHAVVQITDLGLTTRQSPDGLLVWATKLATGAPREGVTISVYNGRSEKISEANTDERGIAKIKHFDRVQLPATIVATLGDDMAFVRMTGSGQSHEGFASTRRAVRPQTLQSRLLVEGFTERGIYRPGQELHLGLVARVLEVDGLSVFDEDDLVVEFTDPRGRTAHKTTVSLSTYGGGHTSVPLSHVAPMGTWSWRASLPSGTSVGRGHFRVEAYRPPRFEVSVKAEEREVETADPVGVTVEGRYLFGAPMMGASVEWRLERWRTHMTAQAHDGFTFSDPRNDHSQQQLASRREPLDPNGKLTLTIDPKEQPSEGGGPWRYRVEAEVQDVDRQTVAANGRVTVHDRDAYLGLRYRQRMQKSGELISAEVLAVDADGAALPGINGIVRFIRTEWHNVERRGPGGSYTTTSEKVHIEEGTCRVRTTRAPSKCRFSPKGTGRYLMVVEGKDRAGRRISAGVHHYVYGPGYVSWRDDDPSGGDKVRRLEIVADQGSYQPGETAKLMIKSPWRRSWALVTLEREEILSEHIVFLDGSAQVVEVPITEAMAPNFYASVTVVRGRLGNRRDGAGHDRLAPTARKGTATIWVDADRRRLQTELTLANDWARPGDEVDVEVKVTDHKGRPARAAVTLWAVDEAVLQLTRYRTPDLLGRFHNHRRLQVVGEDSRVDLLTTRLPALGRGEFAGDGGALDPLREQDFERVRRDFRTTLMFIGEVETDEQGIARTKTKLPDNLTMFRFMATTADGEDRFGSDDARIRVRKPLMIRPALPRFATLGDRLELAATIFNGTEEDGEVEVSLDAKGMEMMGARTLKVAVKKGMNTEVRVPVRANQLGDATIVLKARLSAGTTSETDTVEVPLEVHYPGQWQRAYVDGRAKAHTQLALDFPETTRPDVGTFEINISTTLLTGLAGVMDQLIEYPYGCVEQTTSRTYPLVSMKDLLPDLGIDRDPNEIDKMARAGIARLLSMVTPSGGLSYWPDSGTPHAYGTAYGLMALTEAKTAGFDVPPHVIENASRYLAAQLSSASLKNDYGDTAYDTTRAFAIYVLARTGSPQSAFADKLAEDRETLSNDALAFLLLALVRGAGDASLLAPVKAELMARLSAKNGEVVIGGPKTEDGRIIFSSSAKTLSLTLQALAETAPEHPLTAMLARQLLSTRDGGHWTSTHDNLWGLAAMVSYAHKVEGKHGDTSFVVKLGDETLSPDLIERATPRSARISLPMDKIIQGRPEKLEIARNDGGAFYYGLRARYLRGIDKQDLEPAANGIAVYRRYETLQGQPLTGAVPAGDVVRVRLFVKNTDAQHYVALDDPLPAGLEPINLRLATTGSYEARGGGRFNRRGLRDGAWSFYHSEQRDERVLYFADHLPSGLHELSYLARATSLGRFTAPPTRAEAMYDPTTWGRSAAHTLDIR